MYKFTIHVNLPLCSVVHLVSLLADCHMMKKTVPGDQHIPWKSSIEDAVPFPRMGYVFFPWRVSLEGLKHELRYISYATKNWLGS